nr:MAG TPA: BppU domain protein [Caudoviricetes sp.]
MRLNSTNLKQFEGGRVVKQGDSASLFGFALYDENWVPIDLDGQQAKIHFVSKKGKATFSATVQGSKVTFKIPKVLPVESYLVEVDCAGYVFPSDQSVRVDVVQSAEEYQPAEVVELGKVSLHNEIANYFAGHAVQAYNDGPLVARIEALEARPQATTVDLGPLESRVQQLALSVKALESKPAPTVQTLDLGPLEKRVKALEDRPAPTAPAIDLSAYMTSETAYQTFATYTTLQAQMTSNIKEKHLELGLDALIDEKLRNGGDNFLTSHQASTAYASKEEFQNLLKRVEALESVPI